MQIRTKISVLSYSLGVIVAATLAMLFINVQQVAFYRRNVQFSTERLYEYLELKSLVLRDYKEVFDLERTRDLDLQGDSESNLRQAHQAQEAVVAMLGAIASTNQRHRDFFAAEPFVIAWGDDGAAANETAGDVKMLALASAHIQKIFRLLDGVSATKTQAARIALSNEVEQLYDGSFSELIKGETDDERADERKNYRAIERFQDMTTDTGLALGFLSIAFFSYLIRGFAAPLTLRLRRLMDGVAGVSRGEVGVHVEVDGHDELRQLAETFNRMVTEIAANHAALVSGAKMSALGEMASGIAHEINNPLSVVAGRAAQIRRLTHAEPLDAVKVQKFAEAIEVTAARIAAIVKGLKSFSRNGDQDPFIVTSLGLMINDTLALCTERFKNHGVELTVDRVDPELTVECRATQIIQVLVNLLNNAHDAVETLPEKWIRVGLIDDGETIEISVTDSGSGIPVEVCNKIFQPFFTTKEVGKGTGLGLSIASGIIADHQGKLSVDRGHAHTRFVLCLPKRQVAKQSHASTSQAAIAV